MKSYNMFRLHYSIGVIIFVLFASIPINIKDSLAIENLTQWFSSAFEFNNPGAKSMGIGGAFVGKADDATAAVANPAGLAQLPGLQLYVEGRLSTWDTRSKAWPNDPAATPAALGGRAVVTTQEGEINFDDITDLSFASISFPVKYKPYNIEFNASIFYNKLVNKDKETTLPITFQFMNPGTLALESYNSDLDLEIDEYGFSMAKSFFKDKLMVGASISLALLDIESIWSTNFIGSDGFDHDPGNIFIGGNQSAEIDERDKDAVFRFGVLYRVTDNLMIGGSAQIMPEFDYDVQYIALLDKNSNPQNFTDKSSLSVPDVFSLGLSYQITDNWLVAIEGKYIEYSDLMKGFVSFWGADLISINMHHRNQFDIDDIWETHLGTEYILNVKETPVALRLGGWYEPAHSLEYDAILRPTDLIPNLGTILEDFIDGGDDVFHYTAGIGTVIKNKLRIDAATDIQNDGNKMTFVISGSYELF